MADVRYESCRRLQWEYVNNMDAAYRDRDLNGGNYSRDGVKQLIRAAINQRDLASLTTGAAQVSHREEYRRLNQLVQRESERLGIAVPKPRTPEPRPASAPAPSAAPKPAASAAERPRNDAAKEEVGESFNLADFIIEPGERTLDDVRLPAELKQKLEDAIDPFDPIAMFPKATQGWKPRPRSNFLFFGPPGTGKSHLCGAVNGSMARNYPGGRSVFFLVDGNKLVSKWRGSTGHRLDMIFEEAERFEFGIICIDEFEQLCPDRTKLEDRESYTKNFLTLMEGVGGRSSAMVIACTNHPQLLDPAILSRLENRVFIDYPGEEDVFHFFKDSKQYTDYLGETPEAAAETARALAKEAAARRFSYRNLNAAVARMGDAVVQLNRRRNPRGSAELEHMIPLGREQALEILAGVDSDYDDEQYRLYQDYLQKKGGA